MIERLFFLVLSLALFLFGPLAWAASSELEELKMDKRVGLGISAGGPLALMGMEMDVNVAEDFSLTGGLGTGFDYNTIELKGRYFLTGKKVSPYIGMGFARWWTGGTNTTTFAPAIVSSKFIDPTVNPKNGFSIFLVYPTLGIQFLHKSGFEISGELEYLFKLFAMANAVYGGIGVHWYF
jgi:hypothetical protein